VTIGCVVLTTGRRPGELAGALASIGQQVGVEAETVVVLNTEDDLEHLEVGGAHVMRPGRNLGIPAGRNLGVSHLGACDLLLFLDDDARLADPGILAAAARMFGADPRLGAVTMRLVDPATGNTERRHVPRLRVGRPERSSWVTTLLGGACVVRREAFELAGGLPDEFFYAHEETSLAWRLLDLGYRLWYAGELVVHHPAVPPARHAQYHFLTARNRVLLARMHLPLPLAVAYLAAWVALGLARSRGGRRAALRGFVVGLRLRGVERRPMRWVTVLRMVRYGRPPVL
jgi:GT2 family glycosyltransferase